MKMLNTTPHNVDIVTEGGKVTIPKSNFQIRVESKTHYNGTINDIDFYREELGELQFEGEVEDENLGYTHIIVSRIVAQKMKESNYKVDGRTIVCVPGNLVRDDEGKIIGCKGLISYCVI